MLMHQIDDELQRISHLNRYITKSSSIFRRLNGLLFTLLIIFLMELLSVKGFKVPNNSGIFAIIIVYGVFTGGLFIGFISSILCITYSFYFFSLPDQLFNYTSLDLIRAIISGVTLVVTFSIAGYIHQRFLLCFQEMEESEKKYRNLFHHANDAIILYSLDGNFLPHRFKEVNQVMLHRLGYSREEFLQLSPFQINGDPDFDKVEGIFSALKKERHITIETVHVTKLGDRIPVEISCDAFELNGENVVLSVARDLRDRKRAETLQIYNEEQKRQLEETLQYDQLKTEFFSNISHELRTPINVIFSTLQLFNLSIEEHMPNENRKSVHKYVHIMRQNCYRLLRLVNNIIDISKIDAGYFELDLKNHDIVNLVESITLSVAEYIENKSIELVFDTDIEEKIVACDPDKIERIMLNLLSNAVKFTPKGGNIEVKLQNGSDNIRIIVSDTGLGIPEDKLNLVFKRFKQINKSLTRDHQGSGIGLSLVKSLVELHGGTIDVKSEFQKGTSFIVELPTREIDYVCETAIAYEQSENNHHIERINVEFSDIYSS